MVRRSSQTTNHTLEERTGQQHDPLIVDAFDRTIEEYEAASTFCSVFLLRENSFSSNWRDEIPYHTGSANNLNSLHVFPSRTSAYKTKVGDAHSEDSQPENGEEGCVPILRLPQDYIWSGESEGYQKHVDYKPYKGFSGKEIIDEISKTSKLGKGGFGQVRRVLCNGRLLARKEMLPQQGEDYDLRREATILENLVHRHIVELAGTYTQDGTLYILIYPVAECNLTQMLQMERTASWEHNLRAAFGCLAGALAFIHSKDIAIKHKDIKPANILFCGGIVLLADWGLSNSFKDKADSRSSGWTHHSPAYAAPEVRVSHNPKIERGRPQDVFSLGLVFMEMFAALRRIVIWDQRSIGEPRVSAHHGHEMLPQHYAFLAEGPVPIPEFVEGIQTMSRGIGTWKPTMLFETMLAKSPVDRPSAHTVLQFMRVARSLGIPCEGCLSDEVMNRNR
ncbi:hypothetical protein MMC16_001133 [Acarospora aff. strigata]|nr:hypothetical protein [Acarospora aff. strigata]